MKPRPDSEPTPFDIATAMRVAEAHTRLELVRRGQVFGFAALVATLIAIVALAALGQPWVAGVLAGVGLAGIAAVFVTGQYEPAPAYVPEVSPPPPPLPVPRQAPPGEPPEPRAAIE